MWAIIAAVIAVAASAGVYYQQRKMEAQAKKQAQEAKAVQISGHDSNRGLYTVYGKALVGSTTVWKKVSDKQTRMTQTGFTTFSRGTGDLINGTRDLKSNRFLYRAVSLCAGPIQSVENILIDDEGYQSSRFGQGDNRHFAAAVSLGPTAGQNFSAMRTSYSDFNAWGTSFTGKGVAYAIERLYLDNDKPAYQGEPSTKYLVKGRKLYDPRKDSTSSVYDATLGTSSHRFDTPSTWEWSDNPVLALLDYMTNAEYGRGLALSVIDLPSIADSADKCDVLVDIPARLTNTTGSSYDFYDPESGQVISVPINTNIPNYRPEQGSTSQQKRFRINIAIDPSKELLDNIQEILNVFRGNLSYANGKYRVHMADVASPVLTIGDDDIITGLKISNGDRAQRMNRATVKFINANKQHKTDQASWPSLDSNEDDGLYDTFVTEDQGEKLHKTFTIKGCTDFYQAQDTAEFLVRDSRSNLTVAGTFGSRCFGLVPGDIVSLTYDSAGYSGKYFRVMQVAIDLTSMNVNLQLKEYDSSVYTWNDARGNEPEGLTWQEEVVNASPTTPVIGTLSSTTRTRADGSTALTLTVPFSNIPEQAQYVDVEWGISGTDQYNSQVVFDTENINQVEVPIERDNATYAVRVRYFIADSAGTLMASTFATDTITVGNLTGTKLGGIEEGATANNIYQQASEPTGGTYNDGDIWIDTDDGYRMYLRSGGAWVDRADARIATAITDAAGAQATADGKVVTFYQDGEPAASSSSTGDLWIDTNDNNKLYRYNGSSWDSVRDSGIASAISAAATAQSTADGKIVTFYQDDEPADASSSTGDLWFDTNDNNKLYRYNGTDWVSARDSGIAAAISAAAGAQSTADGKVVTFYQDGEPAAASSSTGDLWIDTNDNNKLYRFNGTTWDSVRDAGIASAISSAATAQSTADGKIVTFYQDGEPAAASSSSGDLWFDTNDNNKLYRYNGTDWVSARDAGIADALANAATAQSTADGKIVTFYQDGEPAAASSSEGDLWIDTNDSNKLYRFNGTDWVAARDSGIASAISDAATAQATADGKVTTFYAASSATPTPEGTGDLWYQTDTQLFFRYNGSAWQEVASYNTGNLADLDTVGTTQIDDDAVTIDKIANTLQSTNYSAGSAGWKLTTDGTFEAGNGTFRGALTATSGSIDSTVTIGGTAASTVVSGAADGASALQNGDAITDGSVGGTTITSTKLYQGTGTHNNTNTGFYLDSSGNFSLKDKLSFDGTTLSVDGNVTVDEFVKAGSGSTAAVMSGRSADNFAFWAGADFDANGGASGANAPFRVTRAGKVIMTNFALYSTTGQKLFDSTDGLLGLPSTQVAASTGSLVSSVSDELTGATDYATIQLSSTQTITVDFDYPLNYLFASGSSEANAYGQIATSITVTIQKSTDASTWSTFGAVTFDKTDSSSASSSQYYVQKQTVNLGYEFGGGTLYFASLQPGGAVDDGNVLNGNVSASLATGTHYLRMQVSYGGSGLAAGGIPSTTAARSITLTTSGAGFTVDSSGNVSDGVATSATTGWVTSNFQGKDASGNVVISGNLTVNGTTTTLNTATLDVEDKNITLNYGAGDTSASANGAGITIQDAVNASTDASILWDGTNDEFDFSHNISAPNIIERPPGITTVTNYDSLGEGIIHTQSTTATNVPYANHNFTLTFVNSSSERRAQLYMADTHDGGLWWRPKQGSSIGWHDWAKIWTSENFSSATITNWNTAYTYSQVGHLPLSGGTVTGTITAPGGNSTQWNSAYGWGNHASAGYLSNGQFFRPSPSGGTATSGGRFLAPTYSGNDFIGIMSTEYASGSLVFGYGAEGKSGGSGFVSTYDNFNGYRSAMRLNASSLALFGTNTAVQTTVGSDLTTMVNRITFETDTGDIIASGSISGNTILLPQTHTKQKIGVYGATGAEWIGTSNSTLELSGASINFNGASGSGTPTLKIAGSTFVDTNRKVTASQIGNSSTGTQLGDFTGADADQWPYIYFYRDTANGWDEGIIKGNSTRGVFGKTHFGVHFHENRSFGFHTSSWDTEMEINGDGRIYQKGPVGIGVTPSSGSTKLYISGAGNDSNPLLKLTGTGSDQYNWASNTLYSSLTATERVIHTFGYGNSTYNQGYIGFKFAGAGSSSNQLTLGLYDANDLVLINGLGQMDIVGRIHANGGLSYLDGLSLNRSTGTSGGVIYFSNGLEDANHALWNDYYGGPVTKGTAGSGTDGIKWNTYSGIEIRGGLAGAHNLIRAVQSGSSNNGVVELYAANVLRFETRSTGAKVSGSLEVNSSANGQGKLWCMDDNHQIILRGTHGGGVSNTNSYYQYGGDLSSGLGHVFYTGGAISSQAARLGIHNDAVKSYVDLELADAKVIRFTTGGASYSAPIIFRTGSAEIGISDYGGVSFGGYNGSNYGQRAKIDGYGNFTTLAGNIVTQANTTAGKYDIQIGNQTTARAICLYPYATVGTRYSDWDLWLGHNSQPNVGTTSSGVELSTSYITGGAAGLSVAAWQGLTFYAWSAAELSGKSAGSDISLNTPKFKITTGGDLQVLGTTRITYNGNGAFAGLSATGKTEVRQFQINRNATNAALWFQEGNLDTNHVMWNDYYGGPTSRGSAGSGLDGIRWNAFRGLDIRGGAGGAYNIIKAINSGGTGNNHSVILYNSNVDRFTTQSEGAYVNGAIYASASSTENTPYSNAHTHVFRNEGSVSNGNGGGTLFVNDRGNHSWGTVAEFRINTASDSDNPTIIFSSAAEGTNTWGVGFGYIDTSFRILRDHGHLNSNWGVAMMTLDRSGNATFAGNVTAYSDRRLKENIQTIPDAVETVKKIRGVTFDWKESGESSMGVIAQEIEEVPILQCLVKETPKDGASAFAQKNVAYGNMVGLLIEAIKEQQQQIEHLTHVIEEMKNGTN